MRMAEAGEAPVGLPSTLASRSDMRVSSLWMELLMSSTICSTVGAIATDWAERAAREAGDDAGDGGLRWAAQWLLKVVEGWRGEGLSVRERRLLKKQGRAADGL